MLRISLADLCYEGSVNKIDIKAEFEWKDNSFKAMSIYNK